MADFLAFFADLCNLVAWLSKVATFDSKPLMDSYPMFTRRNLTSSEETMWRFSMPVRLKPNPMSREQIDAQKIEADVCFRFPDLKDFKTP